MEIARSTDPDQSDYEQVTSVAYPLLPSPPMSVPLAVTPEAAPPPQKAVARARPPRPRKPSIKSLRAQREACELVVKHLPYVLRDLDAFTTTASTANSTDDYEDDHPINAGDHDAQRMRSFLKRTVLLTKEAQEEIAKRSEYLSMLKRHYEGTANVRKLMRGLPIDEWFWMCERWRALGLKYFKPFSESKCDEIVHETLKAIKTHQFPVSTRESGAFGWCDSVHLDGDGQYVRFMIRKTLLNVDMWQFLDHSWSLYQDGDLYKKAHLGDNCKLFHQTLQQISPDVMIIQRVVKYPNLVQLTHSLVIVFRVQTETGFMIVVRCIESARLQSLMRADGLSLGGSFTWDTFDVAHLDEQGECDAVRFTAAGSVGSDNPTYAERWRNELLISLVRYEMKLLDAPIVSVPQVGLE